MHGFHQNCMTSCNLILTVQGLCASRKPKPMQHIDQNYVARVLDGAALALSQPSQPSGEYPSLFVYFLWQHVDFCSQNLTFSRTSELANYCNLEHTHTHVCQGGRGGGGSCHLHQQQLGMLAVRTQGAGFISLQGGWGRSARRYRHLSFPASFAW